MSNKTVEQESKPVEFTVVMNHEEQYSIWPSHKDLPIGWNEVGRRGSKNDCLDYIEEVWTDIRPLSIRKSEP